MKYLLLLLFLFFFTLANGQTWQKVVSEDLVILFPDVPTDTTVISKGVKINVKSYEDTVAIYTLITIKDNSLSGEQKEIKEYLTGVIKGQIKSLGGQLIKNEEDTLQGYLILKSTAKSRMEDVEVINKVWNFVVGQNVYMVKFTYVNGNEANAKSSEELFFKSITLKKKVGTSDNVSEAYRIGYIIGEIIGLLVLLGLFASGIYFLFFRKKRK
jgi:hypothetical protein